MKASDPKMEEDARHGNAPEPVVLRTTWWAVLLSLAATLGACTTSEETVTLEVYSWWQVQSEQDAFDAVRRVHRDKFPNVQVRNLGERTSDGAQQSLSSRMLAGAPPASFQANIGANLLFWTVVDTQADPVHVLEDEVESFRLIQGLEFDLRDKLWGGLFENLVVGKGTVPGTVPFGVPINVHRLNVIYYRPDALAEFKSREGNQDKSFLEIGTLCPEGDYDPDDPALALNLDIVIGAGKSQAFTLTHLAFENVLSAIVARRLGGDMAETREFFEALFLGEVPLPRDPATGASLDVREALECVQYLSKWFRRFKRNNSADERLWDESLGWAEAVEAIKVEGASFTVMGDWANGLLKAELAETPGGPMVKSQAFPGTEGLFIYTSDTFPLPRGTQHPAEAEELLRTIASAKAQMEFSKAKGSIPAIENADLSDLYPWQQEAAEAFRTSERLLATSGFFPPYYPEAALQRALKEMTEWEVVRPDASPANRELRRVRLETALQVFTNAEPTLKFWQDRLRQGPATDALP